MADGDTVLPEGWFQDYPLREGPETMAGQPYVCADGTEIHNVGEKHLVLSSLDWTQTRDTNFQVTQAHKSVGISGPDYKKQQYRVRRGLQLHFEQDHERKDVATRRQWSICSRRAGGASRMATR